MQKAGGSAEKCSFVGDLGAWWQSGEVRRCGSDTTLENQKTVDVGSAVSSPRNVLCDSGIPGIANNEGGSFL